MRDPGSTFNTAAARLGHINIEHIPRYDQSMSQRVHVAIQAESYPTKCWALLLV